MGNNNNTNIKRISLYLNPDNIEDRIVLDYLDKKSKKGTFIKELLYNYITSKNIQESPVNLNAGTLAGKSLNIDDEPEFDNDYSELEKDNDIL